ncbi:hypothetical protein SEA_EVAA_80 [Gordonia phage Evaa]|nr:hypothetical protein SEA_EVAA_80 [Gordonia phage Evaa]
MGHGLDITEGVVSFADSRTDAWHQLGQQVGHTMTPEEALEAAHMTGWNVRKVPLLAQVGAHQIEVPGKNVVVRDNPVTGDPDALGVVGAWWTPFQNEETTSLLYDITEQSGAHIETIGALNGGRRTFVTMKMPDHLEFTSPVTGSTDRTDCYLAIFNHHDGNGALKALISNVRVLCANTWQMAEHAAKSQVSIRHTGSPKARLAEVRALLGLTFAYQDTFAAEVEKLMAREMAEAEVFAAVREVFEVDAATTERGRNSRIETASKVLEVYRRSDTLTDWRGTAFGAYNAVTEYVDHVMKVGKKGGEADQRALRTITGEHVKDLKARAFTTLTPA